MAAVFPPVGGVPFFPDDGRGLNPLLRHPGMIIHPPLLYIGFVSFVIPYAFAIAALITGRLDDRWIRLTRRWMLVAWLFLALGLIVGGRWAYDVLGWGGYWGWDPVENSAFMPFLTGTAFLHSVMIQEKRGMLKVWNLILIILTYALMIMGTFLTRSGVLSSVHAFARSAIAPPFFTFIVLTLVGSLALLLWRMDRLREENQLEGWLSREAAFLLNNLFFMGILFTVFWGTIFPILSELVTGQKITVGPPFYQKAAGPQFLILLILMGIGPLVAWRKASAQNLWGLLWKSLAASVVVVIGLWIAGIRIPWALVGFGAAAFSGFTTLSEYWRGARARRRSQGESWGRALFNLVARNRRRYGGYVIHLGVTFMAIGIVGMQFYQQQTQATLKQGESISLGPYTMTYTGLAEFPTADGRDVARAVVQVYRDGQFVGELYPRRDYYVDQQQPMTIPGVRSSLNDDFYVLLVGWEPISAGGATFKIYLNPLVNFVWLGGFIFILGTLVAAWPEAEAEYAPQTKTSAVVATATGAD
jgi:cytochrome c-type biogenesis protein CcmF